MEFQNSQVLKKDWRISLLSKGKKQMGLGQKISLIPCLLMQIK